MFPFQHSVDPHDALQTSMQHAADIFHFYKQKAIFYNQETSKYLKEDMLQAYTDVFYSFLMHDSRLDYPLRKTMVGVMAQTVVAKAEYYIGRSAGLRDSKILMSPEQCEKILSERVQRTVDMLAAQELKLHESTNRSGQPPLVPKP